MKKALAFFFALTLFLSGAFSGFAAEAKKGFLFPSNCVYQIDKMPDRTPNTMEAEILFSRGFSASTRGGVLIGTYSGENCLNFEIAKSGHPRIYWVGDDLEVHDCVFDKVDVLTGIWIRLALVRDTEKKEARCYLNGKLAQTLSFEDETDGTIKLGHFVLGGDMRSGNTVYFRGTMRSLALWEGVREEKDLSREELAFSGDEMMFFDLSDMEEREPKLIPDRTGHGYDAAHDTFWISGAEEPTGYSHSIAVIGDTQVVTESYPKNLTKIYDWLLANRESRKISFVIGLGDITNHSTDEEWSAARESIFKLSGQIPYILCRGNHDTNATFTKAFGGTEYQKQLCGTFSVLGNAFQLLSAGGTDYLIITLDYGPTDSALTWASRLIEKYPDRKVIIATHGYLTYDERHLDYDDKFTPNKEPNGTRNNGEEIWEKLVSKHEQIFLVLCGHITSNRVVTVRRTGKNGNLVTEILSDGQGVDAVVQNGAGLITMLYFAEDGSRIDVRYYSAIRNRYYMSGNQYAISLSADPKPTETGAANGEAPNEADGGSPAVTETPDEPRAAEGNGTVLLAAGISCTVLAAVFAVFLIRKKKN
ncbi:MAG: metallophosphoesterase [Clostridia bacterium]|nr:metallophosphoesterase [Clostridia bacterium]